MYFLMRSLSTSEMLPRKHFWGLVQPFTISLQVCASLSALPNITADPNSRSNIKKNVA